MCLLDCLLDLSDDRRPIKSGLICQSCATAEGDSRSGGYFAAYISRSVEDQGSTLWRLLWAQSSVLTIQWIQMELLLSSQELWQNSRCWWITVGYILGLRLINKTFMTLVHVILGSNDAINHSETEVIHFLNRRDRNPLWNADFCL